MLNYTPLYIDIYIQITKSLNYQAFRIYKGFVTHFLE